MFARSYDFRCVFDGEIGVLLDIKMGSFFGINSTGSLLWRSFEAVPVQSKDDLIDSLVALSGLNSDSAAKDVEAFLSLMLLKGALQRVDDRTTAPKARTGQLREVQSSPAAKKFILAEHVKKTNFGSALALFLLLMMKLLVSLRFVTFYSCVARYPVNRYAKRRDSTITWAFRSLETASLYIPHSAWCLEKSAALAIQLRTFGVPAKFCIGCRVAPFGAHAWVEIDDMQIGEREDLSTYYQVLDRC